MKTAIMVKTTVRKIFDEVPSVQDIKDKLAEAFSSNEYKDLIDTFFMQSKMKKLTHNWEQDEVDNWIYVSNIYYDDFETYKECFEHPVGQAIQKKAIENGFEIKVEIKEISNILKKMI